MKHIFLLLLSIMILYSSTSSIAGNSSVVPSRVSNNTPKTELKKQYKEKKTKKLMGEKSRVVALLLCLFLGWFGVHRWYLGISDRSKFLFSLVYLILSLFLYIHVLLDFLCILFGKMDFYLDNPGIFIWVMIFFKH